MAGMSVSTGLISGLNYDSLITQLMQVEANPQTLLRNKLLDTQADAKAYRAVSTKFDALRSAAEALTKTATWAAAKATSTNTDVVATAGSTAEAGASVSFSVTSLAATHSVISQGEWSSKTSTTPTDGPTWPLSITDGAGKTASVGLKPDGTITDAAAAINAAGLAVRASVIQLDGDSFRLQLTSTLPGAGGVFSVAGNDFLTGTQGQDASLLLDSGLVASSTTNTFTDLVPGVTITVAKADPRTTTTVSVGSDPTAVTAAVQAMVDAANAALTAIETNTDTTTGSTAVLKGDSTLRSLTSKVLETVSTAIGGNASASTAGLKLTRDGKLSLDKAVFTAKLAADPALAQRLVNGVDAGYGPDQVAGGGDDTPAVQGVARRLFALADQVTNSTKGILTLKAKGEDTEAADLTDRIADWDRRLELRKATLSAQFTALETTLGSLQSQSSWLSSQLASLPSWSPSKS